MLAVNTRSEIFEINIDLKVLGRVVLTLFSSSNITVFLRAVVLHRLNKLRRACLSDFHHSKILLNTFIYHFKMNLSKCADNGLAKFEAMFRNTSGRTDRIHGNLSQFV